MIDLKNVSYETNSRELFSDVTCYQRGDKIGLVGPNGAGKTTLLNTLGLLDQPSEGEYYLDDVAVDNLSSRRRAKIRSKHIGFVSRISILFLV